MAGTLTIDSDAVPVARVGGFENTGSAGCCSGRGPAAAWLWTARQVIQVPGEHRVVPFSRGQVGIRAHRALNYGVPVHLAPLPAGSFRVAGTPDSVSETVHQNQTDGIISGHRALSTR